MGWRERKGGRLVEHLILCDCHACQSQHAKTHNQFSEGRVVDGKWAAVTKEDIDWRKGASVNLFFQLKGGKCLEKRGECCSLLSTL
jgi:hypothetical protein